MNPVAVRPAVTADSTQVFAWRNDELSRQNSRTTSLVEWHDHENWFAACLESTERLMLIAFLQSAPATMVGVVRFDLCEHNARVSINLAPALRGKKLAQPSLQAALNYLGRANLEITRVKAEIRSENVISRKLFEASGFELTEVGSKFTFFEHTLIHR